MVQGCVPVCRVLDGVVSAQLECFLFISNPDAVIIHVCDCNLVLKDRGPCGAEVRVVLGKSAFVHLVGVGPYVDLELGVSVDRYVVVECDGDLDVS